MLDYLFRPRVTTRSLKDGRGRVRIREGDVMLEAEIRNRKRERLKDIMSLSLKMGDRTRSHETQAASRSWKR